MKIVNSSDQTVVLNLYSGNPAMGHKADPDHGQAILPPGDSLDTEFPADEISISFRD